MHYSWIVLPLATVVLLSDMVLSAPAFDTSYLDDRELMEMARLIDSIESDNSEMSKRGMLSINNDMSAVADQLTAANNRKKVAAAQVLLNRLGKRSGLSVAVPLSTISDRMNARRRQRLHNNAHNRLLALGKRSIPDNKH